MQNFWINLFGMNLCSDQLENGETIDSFIGLEKVNIRVVKLKDNKGNIIELIKFFSH